MLRLLPNVPFYYLLLSLSAEGSSKRARHECPYRQVRLLTLPLLSCVQSALLGRFSSCQCLKGHSWVGVNVLWCYMLNYCFWGRGGCVLA